MLYLEENQHAYPNNLRTSASLIWSDGYPLHCQDITAEKYNTKAPLVNGPSTPLPAPRWYYERTGVAAWFDVIRFESEL
jgi:hypothetical protein